jgi:anaerobic selenocysteine-containing dehydrogenase
VIVTGNDYAAALKIEGLADCSAGGKPAFQKRDPKKPFDTGEKIVKTACRACIANCGVLAHVKDGKVVKLEGNPEDPMTHGRMCAKGLSGIQALYHPNRNKYPLVRVGERGKNRWKRITWEEALSNLAQKMMDVRAKYGAEYVMLSTGGGGNPAFRSIGHFANVFGTPNWFEPGCALCYLPRVLANQMMYGGSDSCIADSNCLEIYFPEDTPMKVLVLWGTDPSYSCPSSGGRALVGVRAAGIKTVVIDPRLTPDAAKADIWLPIRPGTDVAMMLGWTRYIIEKKLYDSDFVLKWTNLPYLVDAETRLQWRAAPGKDGQPDTYMVWDKKSNSAKPLEYPWNDSYDVELDGEHVIDGKTYKTGFRLLKESVEQYTLDKTAQICCVDKDMLEKAVRLYAENTPGGLCLGVATDQTELSEEAAMGANVLNFIMGNVERPGSVLQRFRKSGIIQGAGSLMPWADKHLPFEQLKKRLGAQEYKGLQSWHAAQPPAILNALLTGKPYRPKIWIERSGNKLSAVADASQWAKALPNLEYIVHMYMYPTSFSLYADMLLPATEWLESNMITESLNKLVAKQEVVHTWETMDETLFWSLLAKDLAALGHEECKKAFDVDYMGPDVAYFDSMHQLLDRLVGRWDMTWDQYCARAPFEFEPMKTWRHYYVYKDKDEKTGKPIGFSTPSKKLEAYAEAYIKLGRTGLPFSGGDLGPASHDYPALAWYTEPAESQQRDDGLAKEYPLMFTSGRVPFYQHGTLRNAPSVREMYPVPETWLNPVDAAKYGLSTGDWAWVESKRGKIRGQVRVTRAIRPGTLFMERFWNPENLEKPTQGWQEMNVNVLTKGSAPYNDILGTYTLRGFLVKVYKADGAPEGVWTRPEDFKSWLPAASGETAGDGSLV